MSITITSAGQIKLNSGACIDTGVSDRELGIRALVGYHNYFMLNEGKQAVQDACDKSGLNWRAGVCGGLAGGEMPEGAVRVGQTKLRSGDPEMTLYVVPRETAGATHTIGRTEGEGD
jgi:hypothetical protein